MQGGEGGDPQQPPTCQLQDIMGAEDWTTQLTGKAAFLFLYGVWRPFENDPKISMWMVLESEGSTSVDKKVMQKEAKGWEVVHV